MRDIVHYALPLGPLGAIANRAIVAPRLRQIFEFRRTVLLQRFGQMPATNGASAGDATPRPDGAGLER